MFWSIYILKGKRVQRYSKNKIDHWTEDEGKNTWSAAGLRVSASCYVIPASSFISIYRFITSSLSSRQLHDIEETTYSVNTCMTVIGSHLTYPLGANTVIKLRLHTAGLPIIWEPVAGNECKGSRAASLAHAACNKGCDYSRWCDPK